MKLSMEIPSFFREPLTRVMDFVVKIRNLAYDYDLLDSVSVSMPVISVGNLSMGGVGKTPFVAKLIELCRERGLRPAVIARNYKARSRGVHRVLLNYSHPHFNPASFYGDEPYMLAEKFPDVPVFTGPLKYFTAQVACRDQNVDLLIIDDGFQHRALKKDFEIVLIDSSRPETENQIFPAGKMRESFSSLERADLVVLTKTEMAQPAQLENLHRRIPEAIPNVEIRSQMRFTEAKKNYLAVAGIAHPEQFFSGLQKRGLSVKGYLSFSDHHLYGYDDIEKIKNEMRLVGAEAILTTQKDAVKLRAFKIDEAVPELAIDSVSVEIEFLSEPRGLNAFLDQCASH
jgi:tetraacyldisaccharide 4'-kinase